MSGSLTQRTLLRRAMRKLIHKLTAFVLLVALLVGSIAVVYSSAGTTCMWHEFLKKYTSDQLAVCCGAAAVFLMVILYVSTGIPRRRSKDRYLSFAGEGGTVRVSLGYGTTEHEIGELIRSVKQIVLEHN